MNVAFLKAVAPYLIAAALIGGILFGTYSFGVSNEKARGKLALAGLKQQHADDVIKQLADAAAISKANQTKAIDAAVKLYAEQNKTETVFKTITETVTEYVKANPDVDACTLDADGLRIWNNANRGTTTGTGAGGSIASGQVSDHATAGKGR